MIEFEDREPAPPPSWWMRAFLALMLFLGAYGLIDSFRFVVRAAFAWMDR